VVRAAALNGVLAYSGASGSEKIHPVANSADGNCVDATAPLRFPTGSGQCLTTVLSLTLELKHHAIEAE
jgi:hypothetical protein